MPPQNEMLNIPAQEMQAVFYKVLLAAGFAPGRAMQCAEAFTGNSVDGVYTHGIYRFARFVQYVQKGFVHPAAEPLLLHTFGSLEQWDGGLGPGITNALAATDRATALAKEHGIGCVALGNTNHWMRGGTYGWKAAREGFVFIGWTNTIANMPAWGAVDAKLGNNPLVMALPYGEEAIVLDMATSQYSFGAMELAKMKNEMLPVYGGYDKNGQLTNDPAAVLATRRPLPIGYWKGAGLSLLLDILATILSGGSSTADISRREVEYGLSQVFVAIDITKLGNYSAIASAIDNIMEDYRRSVPMNGASGITWPGERILQTRRNNLANGIPVIKKVWEEILSMQ